MIRHVLAVVVETFDLDDQVERKPGQISSSPTRREAFIAVGMRAPMIQASPNDCRFDTNPYDLPVQLSGADGDVRNLELVAAVVAGRWMELVRFGTTTHATRDAIVVADSLDPQSACRAVLAQAALVGAGSLDLAWAANLREAGTKARTARRYLAVEVPRALRDRNHALPGLVDLADELGTDWPKSHSAEQSLKYARGGAALPEPPVWFGKLAVKVPAPPEPYADSGPEVETMQDPDAGEPGTPSPAFDELAAWLQNFTLETGDGWWRKLFPRNKRGSGKAGSPVGSPGGRSRGSSRNEGLRSLEWRREPDGVLASSPWRSPARRGMERRYPEFDVSRGALRLDHCIVRTLQADLAVGGPPERPTADAVLRRRLAPVVLVPGPSRRRSDGNEIDIDAAIDARARFVGDR